MEYIPSRLYFDLRGGEPFFQSKLDWWPVFLRYGEPDTVTGRAVGHDHVIAEGAFVLSA
jgi:hypothetical protein